MVGKKEFYSILIARMIVERCEVEKGSVRNFHCSPCMVQIFTLSFDLGHEIYLFHLCLSFLIYIIEIIKIFKVVWIMWKSFKSAWNSKYSTNCCYYQGIRSRGMTWINFRCFFLVVLGDSFKGVNLEMKRTRSCCTTIQEVKIPWNRVLEGRNRCTQTIFRMKIR